MTDKTMIKEGYSLRESKLSKVRKSVESAACKKSPAKLEKRKPRIPLINTPTKIRKLLISARATILFPKD
ncbi:hypothetical protein RvY_02088 [Ramazzottius varieornatus]|uniref:Uncharacterized protein n=1 Tax=Ramazzottius varieornatus TaxID=947166 RepID=A0A1D1UIK5_RAMVA|nr:hypothetical protein RvY_02088 [Ramazzottius varieornatus]